MRSLPLRTRLDPVCTKLTRRSLIGGLLPLIGLLKAQQNPTYSSDVSVVNVLATVRDKKGKIVSDLKQDDFRLEDEGRQQTIRYFARETGLPLTLGLLVDTSMSQRRVLGQERSASYRFLDQVLRPEKDQAFILHFDHEAELLSDLTSSRQKLQSALGMLQLPEQEQQQAPRGSGGGYPGGGYPRGGGRGGNSGGHRGGAGTVLYDSVLLASDELMRKQSGRKALILLTDGVDHGSKVSIYDAIVAAHRADTLVYSILFADEEDGYRGMGGGMGPHHGGMGGGMPPRAPMERPDGKKVLQQISRETGGGFFEVSKKHPIEAIYDDIQEELRNQYNLGYTPDPPGAAGAFRRITVSVTPKDLVVQSRAGYYPASR
jgi:VWFA-related protein